MTVLLHFRTLGPPMQKNSTRLPLGTNFYRTMCFLRSDRRGSEQDYFMFAQQTIVLWEQKSHGAELPS
jgi:hypothetical protein